MYAAIALGKRHGVKTVLNPAPAVRNLDLGKAREASFLMPNETELAILTSTAGRVRGGGRRRGAEPHRTGLRGGQS